MIGAKMTLEWTWCDYDNDSVMPCCYSLYLVFSSGFVHGQVPILCCVHSFPQLSVDMIRPGRSWLLCAFALMFDHVPQAVLPLWTEDRNV